MQGRVGGPLTGTGTGTGAGTGAGTGYRRARRSRKLRRRGWSGHPPSRVGRLPHTKAHAQREAVNAEAGLDVDPICDRKRY
jgi:hypothetical protein